MEFAKAVLGFQQILILIFVTWLISSFLFKNKKELVSVVISFALLVNINYLFITQKDFMFENFPKQTYGGLILSSLMYFVFFRDVYIFIRSRKTKRVPTAD